MYQKQNDMARNVVVLVKYPCNGDIDFTGLLSADIEQVEKNKIQSLTVIIRVADVEFPKTGFYNIDSIIVPQSTVLNSSDLY